jgi:uncharacterized membrane protein YhaH (DUF805 family)
MWWVVLFVCWLQGKTSRTHYFFWGIGLLAVKHNLDRLVGRLFFDQPWYFWDYLFPSEKWLVPTLSTEERHMLWTLAWMAVPFVAVGLGLTLRRLRDAGWPSYLALYFFVPVVNLFFFALLCVAPSAVQPSQVDQPPPWLDRFMPHSFWGSAGAGAAITGVFGLLLPLLSVQGFGLYGWGLFFGVPFFMGFSAALLHAYRERRELWSCLVVGWLSLVVAGSLLLFLALEGVVCLLMALPLAAALSFLGSIVAYALQDFFWLSRRPDRMLGVAFSLWPALLWVEQMRAAEAPLRQICTEVRIAAAPAQVWPRVVAFSRIGEKRDWIFHTGIAYPIEARIEGKGVGAIRHCEFSTGSFIEPITIWDEPNRLAFSVTQQPHPMLEWSPYRNLTTEHLDHYFVSEKGEFHLESTPEGGTLLRGTTWYRHRLWPQFYWGPFSNYLIHAIHFRVLEHIKQEIENSPSGKEEVL